MEVHQETAVLKIISVKVVDIVVLIMIREKKREEGQISQMKDLDLVLEVIKKSKAKNIKKAIIITTAHLIVDPNLE